MSNWTRSLLVVAFAALSLGACNGGTDTGTHDTGTHDTAAAPTPVVRVTGGAYLTVGEIVQLTASTLDGSDSGYTWASSDDTLASVDATGTVTALQRGEVTITATGNDTQASGTLQIALEETIPHLDDWAGSAHADNTAEAFNHWNGEDPPEVPTTCARCHTTTGFRDYLGDDGTTPFSVDSAQPIGQVIRCEACHNSTAMALDQVTFPSGVTLTGLGHEAICMTCHQGRASKDTVDESIGDVADDTVDTSLGFTNIHYFAAGATLEAGRVRGGYQYDTAPDGTALLYDRRFRHVPGRDTCIGCHDQHTLKLRFDKCQGCHPGVTNNDATKNIRMMSSLTVDYDGDGDLTEGLYYEVDGLRQKLYAAIQTYAHEQTDMDDVCYAGNTYPYWFVDTDGSGGPCSTDEASFSNSYSTWTPRLLEAAYNDHMSIQDPGSFAHNGKYIIELLYDSITDLNSQVTNKVDMSQAHREDHGHFDGAAPPFRHWDPTGTESEKVDASCTRCHGGSQGFIFHTTYLTNTEILESPNGLDCATCHPSDWNYDKNDPQVRDIAQVDFPSGIILQANQLASPEDAICANCHLGRESKKTIDDYLASTSPSSLSFRNVHYLPAASTYYGTEVQTGYQYDRQSYAGPWNHPPGSSCLFCHSPADTDHTFNVADNFSKCTACHLDAQSVEDIRYTTFDYDGDGDVSEPLPDELMSFQETLLAALWSVNTPHICYEGDTYPYWFEDSDSSGGHCDPGEATFANQYKSWTPAQIKAAHNYQMSVKDPGAWAHNMDYITDLLYDSTFDLTDSAPSYDGGTTRYLKRNPPYNED